MNKTTKRASRMGEALDRATGSIWDLGYARGVASRAAVIDAANALVNGASGNGSRITVGKSQYDALVDALKDATHATGD